MGGDNINRNNDSTTSNTVNILRDSKIADFLNIKSNVNLLEDLLKPQVEEGKISAVKTKKYMKAAADIFQSITTSPSTINEFLTYMYENYEDILTTTKEEDGNNVEFFSGAIRIVHAKQNAIYYKSGTKDKEERIEFKDTPFCIKKSYPESKGGKYIFDDDYGLIRYEKEKEIDEIFNIEEIAQAKEEDTEEKTKNSKKANDSGETEDFLLNKRKIDTHQVIASKDSPSLAFIMLNNPNLRAGTKNSVELSTFFNLLSTVELSKCQPYFDATFILPSEVENQSGKVFKTASITQFLNGTLKNEAENKTTDTYNILSGDFSRDVIRNGKTVSQKVTATNISSFLMPQTINNFDEIYIGHYENIDKRLKVNVDERLKRFRRSTSVHDITRPFMTLTQFNIDVAPTKGLMSFKTGKLSIILHDRTRMVDIAPFIKPDLFGSVGAEIAIEYGWSHADVVGDDKTKNYLGKFLNENRVVEKYIITNSTFNIDKNGQVNIDLSIAARGPIDIRTVKVESNGHLKIEQLEVKKSVEKLENKSLNSAKKELIKFNETTDFANISISDSDIVNDIKEILDLENTKQARAHQSVINNINKVANSAKGKDKNTLKGLHEVCVAIRNVYNNFSIEYTTKLVQDGAIKNFAISPTPVVDFEGNSASIIKVIKSYIDVLIKMAESINGVTKKLSEANANKSDILKKMIGGLDEVDPFYDKDWLMSYYEISLQNKESRTNGVGISGLNTDDAGNSRGGTKYVTFGLFITALIGTHLTNTGKFNEIQIVSHTLNNFAGLAKNKNIASLLINKKDLVKFLGDIFDKKTSMTLEGVISQVINRFINTRVQILYGLSDNYRRDANGKVSFKFPSKLKKKNRTADKAKKIIGDKLQNIYYGLLTPGDFEKTGEVYTKSDMPATFTMPRVKFSFDTMTTKESGYEKTICRISIFDQNDNPFKSVSQIMQNQENEGGALYFSAKLNKLYREFKSNQLVNKKGEKAKLTKVKATFYEQQALIIEEMRQKGVLDDVTNDKGEVIAYKLAAGGFNKTFKQKFKTMMPSITYGTHNSAVLEASVSTVNESKLNTVYLTRSDRNNETAPAKVFFDADLPLRILPAQANITLFGCPFANFGQYIFLDFETGTTIDNTYAITGIKHSLTPGKFTTSLTLSYGDVYGKYENAASSIQRAVNSNQSVDSEYSRGARVVKVKSNELVKQNKISKKEKKVYNINKKAHKRSRLLNIALTNNKIQVFLHQVDNITTKEQEKVFYRVDVNKKDQSKIIKLNCFFGKITSADIEINLDQILKEKNEVVNAYSDNKVKNLIEKQMIVTINQDEISITKQPKVNIKTELINNPKNKAIVENLIKESYPEGAVKIEEDKVLVDKEIMAKSMEERIKENKNIFVVQEISRGGPVIETSNTVPAIGTSGSATASITLSPEKFAEIIAQYKREYSVVQNKKDNIDTLGEAFIILSELLKANDGLEGIENKLPDTASDNLKKYDDFIYRNIESSLNMGDKKDRKVFHQLKILLIKLIKKSNKSKSLKLEMFIDRMTLRYWEAVGLI